MILKYYYPELASTVRIKSESLCLDHTFVPAASVNPLSLQDLCKLSKEKYIDPVRVFLPKTAEAYYIDLINNEKVPVYGWVELNEFEVAEPYTRQIFQ